MIFSLVVYTQYLNGLTLSLVIYAFMISVIVPVYNAEQYLHRCIDSILAQSYADFELLLIDDGSPDNCGTICDEYAIRDSRVRVFHKENGGVSSARNLGLDNAQGEYITFCDADDYVGPNWLSIYRDAIVKDVDLAIQGILEIGNDREISKSIGVREGNTLYEKQQLILALFAEDSFCYTVVKLFRRSIMDAFNIRFDESSVLGEDAQFIAKYFEHAMSFVCVDSIGYYYYLPPANKVYKGGSNYSTLHILKSLDIIFEKKIPLVLINRHIVALKGYMLACIIKGETIASESFDLYERLSCSASTKRRLKDRFITTLILRSEKPYSIAPFILKFIHILLK